MALRGGEEKITIDEEFIKDALSHKLPLHPLQKDMLAIREKYTEIQGGFDELNNQIKELKMQVEAIVGKDKASQNSKQYKELEITQNLKKLQLHRKQMIEQGQKLL